MAKTAAAKIISCTKYPAYMHESPESANAAHAPHAAARPLDAAPIRYSRKTQNSHGVRSFLSSGIEIPSRLDCTGVSVSIFASLAISKLLSIGIA